MSRLLSVISGILVTLNALLVTAGHPGIVNKMPREGRFVRTSQGYMVPYAVKVPGSAAVIRLVPIPGGEVTLNDVKPPSEGARTVTILPFWMGRYEITWSQYTPFMATYELFRKKSRKDLLIRRDVDAVTAPTPVYSPQYRFVYGQDDELPASTMTQFAAKQYTKWLSRATEMQFRLPTELEWQYACRAKSGGKYGYGNDVKQLSKYAVFGQDPTAFDIPGPGKVGRRQPNAWGLYDMHGNLWEWVLDGAGKNREFRLPPSGTLNATDVIGWPLEKTPRTLCGGSYLSKAGQCQVNSRIASDDTWWNQEANIPLSCWWLADDEFMFTVGFRIIQPLGKQTNQKMSRFWDADCQELIDDVWQRVEEGRGAVGKATPTLDRELFNQRRIGNK